MTTAQKHGFTIAQAAGDSEAVKHYCADHLSFYGYPADIQPASTVWFGICRDDRVWGVLGIKPIAEKILEVADFYLHRSRWGVLAGYAGLEALKEFSENNEMEIVTATPKWNKSQMRAMERVFGVDGPTHFIYRYRPWEVTK